MTEFRQVIGRGTRVHEEEKYYLTLIDFRGATYYADPEFDGAPVQIYEPGAGDSIVPPEDVPLRPRVTILFLPTPILAIGPRA